MAPPRILVRSHIWMREAKEGLKLDNLRSDHVMIRSELKYLIGAKTVDLTCWVFGGKTAPFPTVRVFRVVRPVATVRFQVEPNPEPTREFWPIANTRGKKDVMHRFAWKGSKYIVYLLLPPINTYITQDAKPKMIDAPLTAIFGMGQ